MPDEYDADLKLFAEFVANIQATELHKKWMQANPGEATKWASFRSALLAGQKPAPPAVSSRYGKHLVSAGKMHVSISRLVGQVRQSPAPAPAPPSPPPPPPLVVPVPPTGLTATPGDGLVALTWNLSPAAEQVDSYQVYYAVGAGPVQNPNLSTPGTQYTVTGLTNGQVYHFRVSAHNVVGYGEWSVNAVSATPNGVVVPPPAVGGKHLSSHHQNNYLLGTMQYGEGDYVLVGTWAASAASSDLSIPVYGYSSAVNARNGFWTGLSPAQAMAGGHELRDSDDNVISVAGYAGVACDVGRGAYQTAWANEVIAQRVRDGAEGVFIDDLVQSVHILSGTPSIYPTQPSWRAAVEEFCSVVVPLLRNAGLLVMLNTGAWWPGHDQGGAPNYDNGDGTKDWAVALGTAGGTTNVKCMIEPGFQTVDSFPGTTRTMGVGHPYHWDGWGEVITVVEAAGLDYVGMAHGGEGDSALNLYLKASMLLFMNRPGSSCMFHCDNISSTPFGPLVSADLGLPTGAAFLNGQEWRRNFEGGYVRVNPFIQTASITLGSTSPPPTQGVAPPQPPITTISNVAIGLNVNSNNTPTVYDDYDISTTSDSGIIVQGTGNGHTFRRIRLRNIGGRAGGPAWGVHGIYCKVPNCLLEDIDCEMSSLSSQNEDGITLRRQGIIVNRFRSISATDFVISYFEEDTATGLVTVMNGTGTAASGYGMWCGLNTQSTIRQEFYFENVHFTIGGATPRFIGASSGEYTGPGVTIKNCTLNGAPVVSGDVRNMAPVTIINN